MKKSILTLSIVALSFLAGAAEDKTNKVSNAQQVRTAVTDLIGNPGFEQNEEISIAFTITEDNELKLKKIKGQSPEIKAYIAEKLHNTELPLGMNETNKLYHLDIVFRYE